MTDDHSTRPRRSVLAALGTTTTAALAGCLTQGSDPEPTETERPTSTTTDTPTPTDTTEEPTTTEQGPMEFEEIYMEEVNEPWVMESGREITRALRNDQIDDYEDPSDFESFGDMMVQVKDDILGGFSVINDSQEFTKHLQHAVHNDLGYDASEVRVLGRDMAGGGTYTAIFHRNEDGDWVKDLALPASGEEGYLAHNDTEDDINFNHEASAGLWNTWKDDKTPSPATNYSHIKEVYSDEDVSLDPENIQWIDRGNDHIVVGEPYEEPTVGYTAEAAQRVEEIQNWHENDTFNEEMAVVEQATEAYHNSEEPYIDMRMEDGEVTAVPTEEHTGPENLYG